jgi:hypothetical protein
MSLTLGSLSVQYFETLWFLHLFFDGMVTAGSVWALNTIIEFFEESRIK